MRGATFRGGSGKEAPHPVSATLAVRLVLRPVPCGMSPSHGFFPPLCGATCRPRGVGLRQHSCETASEAADSKQRLGSPLRCCKCCRITSMKYLKLFHASVFSEQTVSTHYKEYRKNSNLSTIIVLMQKNIHTYH